MVRGEEQSVRYNTYMTASGLSDGDFNLCSASPGVDLHRAASELWIRLGIPGRFLFAK